LKSTDHGVISRVSVSIMCTGGEYRGVRHDWHLKIYGATLAAGPPDNAKLSDVLEHLNET
jgi:hypothetical protein